MQTYIAALSFIFVLAACQRAPFQTTTEMGGAATVQPQLIQSADGTLYSKSCLQEHASQIQSQGSSAMGQCKMKLVASSSGGSASTERSRFFHASSYAWIYYPPTYWSNNNSSNYFCGWVFGGSSNFNCYALFGYNNYSNYRTYYNPSCDYCLYAPNPNRCQNHCYNVNYYSVY